MLTPYSKEQISAGENPQGSNDFKQIILRHFVKKVKEKVIESMLKFDEDVKYFQYYNDFIQTVENREIRSKRFLVLNQINYRLKTYFNSQYHSNNKGGFVEVLKEKNAFKIRFKNSDLYLEKWIDNKRVSEEKLNKEVDFEKIINKISGTVVVI